MERITKMNYDDFIEATDKLDASAIQTLLEREGWEPLDAWDDILIYRRPKRERVFNEIVLPKWKDDLYAQFMLKAVRRYAEFNNLSAEDSLEKFKRADNAEIIQKRRAQAPVENKRPYAKNNRKKFSALV